jgi:hypothetical protein
MIAAACAAAAAGCFALNRRVQRLASTELGIGKAVSEMSLAVSRFEAVLAAAEKSTREASAILEEQLVQARRLVVRLEPTAALPRAAAAVRETSGKTTTGDPLSDVVPKGSSPAAVGGQAGACGPAPSVAEKQLADLALRRSTMNPDGGTGLHRARA